MVSRVLSALAAVALLTLVAACAQERTAAEKEGTLIYGFSDNFKTWDPAKQVFAQETAIMHLVYEPMVRWGPNLTIEPYLAESWEVSDDCTLWTFHLRQGIRFHDGTMLTSAAIKSQLDRIMDPDVAATRAHMMVDVERIETPDDHTVRFQLSNANCMFVELMSSAFASVYSPKAFETYGADIAQHPVGTGAFIFESWDQARMRLVFRRNPDYWRGDIIKFDRLEFHQVREATTRLTLLEQDRIDMASIAQEHVQVARRNPSITVQSTPYLSIVYIGFNTQKPPFDDVRVRQACNYAVNKQHMIDYVFFGVGTPARGPLPDVLPAFNDEVRRYDYDPDRARALLAEAGHPNGLRVNLWTMETGSYRKVAEATVGYLREIGVHVNMIVYDEGVYWDKFDEYLTPTGQQHPTRDGAYDMYIGGWVGGEAPQQFLEPLFQSRSLNNVSFYSNPEVDRLLVTAKNEPDPAIRTGHFKTIQALVVEDAPWIFAYHGQNNVGISPRVQGFRVHPSGRLFFDNVRLVEPTN
jgi:peptide/nickel transport system substrate-binding protein